MTKKQLIIDSAVSLFSEKGVESTSVQQITEHCGISKGAFYLSFKSKEELVSSIIEHFMNNIIIKVDQAVSETLEPSKKMLMYYYHTLTILSEYTGFAEILMREKIATLSTELIEKLHYYVALSNENLMKLLVDVYGEQIKDKQYDLLMVVNGMVQAYLQWIFEARQPFDIMKLSHSLVEKTDIIATECSLVFLDETMTRTCTVEETTNEDLVIELRQLEDEADNAIEAESIGLLLEELTLVAPRKALVLGLLSNLSKNRKFDWISFLIKRKFEAR